MRSVALRREVLLRNEKWLRSSCLNASKPFRRLRRHFSQASPALLAASSHRSSRMLCVLLVGSADTSRRLCRLFSQALPALPAASFRRISQMFFAFSSALPTLPAGSACKLSPLLARVKISSLSSPSVRLPPAEPAKSPSTFGSREFLSSVLLLR